MRLTDIKDVHKYLEGLGRYNCLCKKYINRPKDRSIWFEMVFAYWLEEAGISPRYEQNVNVENDKTVDFVTTLNGLDYHINS